MSDPEWRVIKIIDEQRIVVRLHGGPSVHRGDEIEIYEKGPRLHDPADPQYSDVLKVVKAVVEVDSVESTYAVCVIPEVSDVSLGLIPLPERIKRRQFQVREEEVTGGWKYGPDTKIKVGDLARVRPK